MGKDKKYNTVLGEDTVLEGKLTFNGILRIDGCFKGKITAAGTLVIGDNGFVEADIHTTNVLCSGEIRGAVYADEVIEILEPGKVFGNIEAPDIVTLPLHEPFTKLPLIPGKMVTVLSFKFTVPVKPVTRLSN